MSTISEEVTLSVKMSEPGTVWVVLALDLTFLWCVGESVVGHYVVLRQLAGSFLKNFTS